MYTYTYTYACVHKRTCAISSFAVCYVFCAHPSFSTEYRGALCTLLCHLLGLQYFPAALRSQDTFSPFIEGPIIGHARSGKGIYDRIACNSKGRRKEQHKRPFSFPPMIPQWRASFSCRWRLEEEWLSIQLSLAYKIYLIPFAVINTFFSLFPRPIIHPCH